jgi:naphthalene 1,2-dioxygenase system ferredoxin subunit
VDNGRRADLHPLFRNEAGDEQAIAFAVALVRNVLSVQGMRNMSDEAEWVTVAQLADVGEGEVLGVEIGDKSIALYNLDSEIFATDNICTHAFALLSDGWLDGDCIECPLHAGRFEVRTGKALGPPVDEDIKVYPVRIVGSDIQVKPG